MVQDKPEANVTPFVDLGDGHALTDSQKESLLNNVIDQDLLDRIK